ncbi:MAG TPA: DUF3168 domain-containing protein [Rhizomicrobium sp.]|jgi:hypothetical protein|nr:DUF3168 domain-containing protein [Rhizomicrobium sp.]
MSAALALQEAVFAALTGDAGIIALLGEPPRVYDEVPRDAVLPYAVIGDASESDWSTKTDHGASLLFPVQIWSRASGYREAKLIAGAVRTALDGAALTLSGATLIDLSFDSAAYARESDGMTRRAELKFRALVEI